LDRLRDEKMIPEPKNYTSWRDQISELEAAAEEGSYLETWLLPTGQTYRVTGKPHPDGAIAFLFEDVSDEISLTRKFRSQVDTFASVLDNIGTAIAVFSNSGSMIFANAAYRDLWGTQQDSALANSDFNEEINVWLASSAPSPVWVKLQEAIVNQAGDFAWNDSVLFQGKATLACQYAPLPDGNHLVTFSAQKSAGQLAGSKTPPDLEALQERTG